MSRQEAVEQYNRALRQGRRCYKDCVLRGRYPYPQVLDEILNESMVAGQVDLGVIEIPAERVAGTKTAGRRSSFAADFMPLLDHDTEFATKWMDLCQAHLEEGIRDPVRCYEYMGRFYVQEGNKRVSVLKSYSAPTIPAYVIRMVPVWSEEPAVLAYYDFMHAYQMTGLYRVCFSRTGRFPKLQAALGFETDHVWTEEERRRFVSDFACFEDAFRRLGGADLGVTAADALLVWLKVYSCEDLHRSTPAELLKTLQTVWPDVKADPDTIAVNTGTEERTESGLLTRILKAALPREPLHIAFVSNHRAGESDWARAHDLGRQYLEAVMGEEIAVQNFQGVSPEEGAAAAMEEAIANGAQVIFATTPPLIGACRKIAVRHPAPSPCPTPASAPTTAGSTRGSSSPGPSPELSAGGTRSAMWPAAPSSASPPASTPSPWGPG